MISPRIDKLLDNIRALFVGQYGEQLKSKHTSTLTCDKFAPYFERQIQELEGQSDGGDSRDAHYLEFHGWLRERYAEYGRTHVYFA